MCSISPSRWLETKTVMPSSAKDRIRRRTSTMPAGVEAVGGLVEHQQGRLAQQGGGDAQALLHPEGVALEGVAGALRKPDAPQGPGRPPRRRSRPAGPGRAGSLGRTAWGRTPAPRPAPPPAAGSRPGWSGVRRGPCRFRPSAGSGPAASGSSWSCPPRWVRRSRTPIPPESRCPGGRPPYGNRIASLARAWPPQARPALPSSSWGARSRRKQCQGVSTAGSRDVTGERTDLAGVT